MANNAEDTREDEPVLVKTEQGEGPDLKRQKLDDFDVTLAPQAHDNLEAQDKINGSDSPSQLNNADADNGSTTEVAHDTYPEQGSEFPELPIYHPSFKKAEKMAEKPIKLLIDTLKYSEHKPRELRELLRNIQDSRTFTYPEAKVVGLLGYSGVGTKLPRPDSHAYKLITFRQIIAHQFHPRFR